MLFLWSVSKAAECIWRHLREDATLGDRITGTCDWIWIWIWITLVQKYHGACHLMICILCQPTCPGMHYVVYVVYVVYVQLQIIASYFSPPKQTLFAR